MDRRQNGCCHWIRAARDAARWMALSVDELSKGSELTSPAGALRRRHCLR